MWNRTSKEKLVAAATRQKRRAEQRGVPSTPAMRLGLARGPVSLNTILYTDWASRCFAEPKAADAAKPGKQRSNTATTTRAAA